MIGHHLDFSGLLDLDKELERLSKAETRQVERQANRAGAAVFRDEARKRAPRRSGKLARNIVVSGVKGETTAGVTVLQGGKKGAPKNAFYWRFVELGTSKMAAIPFIRPAFDAKEKEATEAAEAKFLEAVDKVLMK